MNSSGFSRPKYFRITFATILAVAAALFAFSPARAGNSNPSLVVRLNADGSLIVSQRGKDAGAPVTLPTVKTIPAEIDTLLPRKADRKTLAIAAESTGPYGNLNRLIHSAKDAGFVKVALLRLENEPQGKEQTIRLQDGPKDFDTSGLFVSLGDDGNVILSLGMGEKAHGTMVKLDGVSEGLAGLVPTKRAKKHTYFRADLTASTGDALGLLRKLYAVGFTNLTLVGEQPDET